MKINPIVNYNPKLSFKNYYRDQIFPPPFADQPVVDADTVHIQRIDPNNLTTEEDGMLSRSHALDFMAWYSNLNEEQLAAYEKEAKEQGITIFQLLDNKFQESRINEN